MSKEAVAYLDILGFKNFTDEDIYGASELLRAYQTQIDFRKLENKHKYPQDEKYKEIYEKWLIDSFKYYIPFSDSIFLTSDNPDRFIKQLSTFIIESFLYHRRNASPSNLQHPEEVEILTYRIGPNGQPNPTRIKQKWFPLLFRGGISFGEVIFAKQGTIENRNDEYRLNLLGPAVCKAVLLEESVKEGPYLICDHDFYDQLPNKNTQQLIEKLPNSNLYQILYPAYLYYGEPVNETTLINHFNDLFRPVVEFWKARNHESYSEYYFNFMKLIIKSTIRYYETKLEKVLAINHIKKVIDNLELNDKSEYLI